MFIHEDDRRKLIEWSGGKVSKVLVGKAGCEVGDHYHRNKEERFMLISGVCTFVIGDRTGTMDHFDEFTIPPNTYHLFSLSQGAVLLGVCSEKFDPSDEIKGRP